MITAVTTISDAIVIKLLDTNTILTGVGNELHLHTSLSKKDEISSGTKILPMKLKAKLHGIELGTEDNADKLLAYGEKEFMLLQCLPKYEFQLLYRGALSDWISSAKFLSASNEFVFLTAHSVLLHCIYSAETKAKCKIIKKSSCTDKSTLYCSHLHGNTWHELVVFGGNAFGELLIWQPALHNSPAGDNDKQTATLLQRIPTHNGVIFSIDYNEHYKMLTTTSDDRSIRFWKLPEVMQSWAECKLTAMCSGYGHVARVFQGKIISYANEPYAITVGEDSYFCIWQSNGALVYKRRQHFGAVIWNFAYDETTQTLYSVGSTGNLLTYDLKSIFANELKHVEIMPSINFDDSEYVAKIKCLQKDLIVGVTNKNHMIYINVLDKQMSTNWHLIPAFDGYKSTVLEVYKDMIALCGYKRLTLFKYNTKTMEFTKIFNEELLSGVIRAFLFLSAEHYLISDEYGNCLLLRAGNMQDHYSIDLPKCKERWLTSALMIDDELLLVSNRQGNLMLYKCNNELNCFELKSTLKQLHGNLGATTLKLMATHEERIFVKSAGHDGVLRTLSIERANCELKLYARENVPVAWVEHLLLRNDCRTRTPPPPLLLGFNDNHFVVWSKMYDFLLQIPCGGGHRCWHFHIDESIKGQEFIQLFFIKNKQVLMHRLKLYNKIETSINLPIKNDWHVRPCNVVEIIQQAECLVIMSAGDDNLVKITTFKDNWLKQQAEVHTHISNIRALKVKRLNEESCLIFSAGGRAQLCITKLNLRSFQFQEMLNYTIKPTTTHNAEQQTDGDGGAHSFDPETRIMSCDILALSATNEFSIYLGCSDGYLRKLHLTQQYVATVETEIFYGKCILQVRLIASKFLLVAATDGLLSFYDLQLKHKFFELRHHASGVNALSTHFIAATNTLHLLSGGDDQAVAYTALNLELTEKVKFHIEKTLNLKNLHTAQVTAAALRFDADTRILSAYTSGVDQNLYKYNLQTDAIEQEFHSCIADIKGFCLSEQQYGFLYGCGLQVVKFN